MMEAEELLTLRRYITRLYVQRTGKPVWMVSEDMERDVFMSAEEAYQYGIVDMVATSEADSDDMLLPSFSRNESRSKEDIEDRARRGWSY